MAAFTSTKTGNWSDTTVWGGGPPGAGDTATIAAGHTVTVDVDTTVGSNASAVGHAVTINSTGTLRVNSGVTLTLRGNDITSNTLMLINSGGTFSPLSGSIVLGDCASDYQSMVLNKGALTASGVTFSSPAANVSWGNSASGETPATVGWAYDSQNKIACVALANQWVSNAAGTGPGAFGDSSVAITGPSPATICQTEVAMPSLLTGGAPTPISSVVNAVGKYAIDYDRGLIYFYHDPAAGTPSITVAYKYLTFTKGWGISSTQTTGNSVTFDGCTFQYMGPATGNATKFAVMAQNKKTVGAQGDSSLLFKFTNNTVKNCQHFLGLIGTNTGTLADPILVTGNTWYATEGDNTFGSAICCYRATANTYLSISSNTVSLASTFALFVAPVGGTQSLTGLRMQGNAGRTTNFATGVHLLTIADDGAIADNKLDGCGQAVDYRGIQGLGGTAGHELVVTRNTFSHFKRSIHHSSNLFVTGSNVFFDSYHHVCAADVTEDVLISNFKFQGNLVYGAGAGGANYNGAGVDIGYNHRQHLDGYVVSNNTFIDLSAGMVSFGDTTDAGAYTTLITNCEVHNNLALMNAAGTSTGVFRTTAVATLTRIGGLKYFDNNNIYNYNTLYGTGAPHQATFTQGGAPYNRSGTRNVSGVSLHTPSYASNQTGMTLALAVNVADSDVTLAWGGGTPVQLIFGTNGTGIATAGANTTSNSIVGLYSGTLTNGGAAWSTTRTSAACPQGSFVKITGGTGAGQVRAITNNTATVLTVVPAWTTVPDATSTYAIYQSEVTLTDSGGTQTIHAGVDLRSLPTTSQTDSSIGVTIAAASSNPNLVAANTAQPAADYGSYKLAAKTSPAWHAGAAFDTPAADFFGVPYGSPPSVGFAELLVPGGVPIVGGGLLSSPLVR